MIVCVNERKNTKHFDDMGHNLIWIFDKMRKELQKKRDFYLVIKLIIKGYIIKENLLPFFFSLFRLPSLFESEIRFRQRSFLWTRHLLERVSYIGTLEFTFFQNSFLSI